MRERPEEDGVSWNDESSESIFLDMQEVKQDRQKEDDAQRGTVCLSFFLALVDLSLSLLILLSVSHVSFLLPSLLLLDAPLWMYQDAVDLAAILGADSRVGLVRLFGGRAS